MTKITPVILCGGSGKRLWPLSRQSYPKQFVAIIDGDSLFQIAMKRFSGPDFEPPILLTGDAFKLIVKEQAEAAGITDATVLVEPTGRNTGPAILAAALHARATDPDSPMLVLPSDHVNQDDAAFLAAVRRAAAAASDGAIVTFGAQPTHPATGFGYIELAEPIGQGNGAPRPFLGFVEKPSVARAEEMIASQRYLWNSGTFCFLPGTAIAAFEQFEPAILPPVTDAVENNAALDIFTVLGEAYADAKDISVDYAIMERIDNGVVVPIQTGWNDLGSWQTVWQESHPDEQGVATTGGAVAIDCEHTLLRSEHEDIALVGIGLKNIVAVAMRDAVLVSDMDRTQDVKLAVSRLAEAGAKQAGEFPRNYRPWGWYETLVLASRFQVKQIMVKPGQKLSLQSHVHRAEHWVVVSGTARVTIGDDVSLLTENQSTYIPLGAIHRLENPGKVELRLIEVQTGVYLQEDDIVRYEDIYHRA